VTAGDGERVAVRTQDRSVSYATLLGDVSSVAAGLHELGVRPEDRVALALFDGVE
jgi:benzoate-CoA ligase